MIAAFIHFTFEWLWLVITWTFIGAPLFAVLIIWRLATERGWARRIATIALSSGFVIILAVWFFFDQYDRHGNSAGIAMIAGFCVLLPSWAASAAVTQRGRIWGDMVVLAAPTALGFWAWYSE